MRYCLHNCFCRSVNSNGKLLYCVVVYDCNDVKGHLRQAIIAAGDGATQALSLIEAFNTRG